MDKDEIKRKLVEAGIPVGGWGQKSATTATPTIVAQQQELFGKVRILVQAKLDELKQQRAALHEAELRKKHGGGR